MKPSRKIVVLSVFLILCQGGLQAQSINSAKKLLNKLSYWKKSDAYQIDFMYSVDQSGKDAASKKGTLYVKGEYYVVDIFGQKTYGDGKSEITLGKGGKVIVLQAHELLPFTPQYMLRLLFLPETNISSYDKENGNIKLEPIKPNDKYSVINIHLFKEEKIQAIRVEAKNGARYHCFILKVKTGVKLSDEFMKP